MSLYTFPSNKLEYLVQVLSKLLDIQKKDIFTPTQLIVGSRGMQHWLSMELAKNRDIAMNQKYDMVNSYILEICYELTSKKEFKKSYSKDVLTWRIFKLLDTLNCDKLIKYYEHSLLKKYQLSAKISEVFSAYLVYRTDWLEQWEDSKYIKDLTDSNTTIIEEDEQWQSELWRLLVKEIPDTPYSVQNSAIKKLNKTNLQNINIPNDIYIFGINAISPKNLNFIFELSKHIDVNILYIDPCSEYWYDLKNARTSTWLETDDYEAQPLLANLGQQGKEFFNMLLDNEKKRELDVFQKFENGSLDFNKLENNSQNYLVSLQRNLLELNCEDHTNYNDSDNSISINSCHSPLREVQVLHDKLLDMIKVDDTIKPRDILVMCPNIEDYAPYIDSVFTRGFEDKKLPCSIADRTLLDSEPLAASFIDLLQLPESNFEVNKILDYIEVPAIQQKFNITQEQLETIRYWLKESCIHHSNDNKTFSWSWGLRRLMLGFAYNDSEQIINDELLTVPLIEGAEVLELGGLYELLELLDHYTKELKQYRTLEKWADYLLKMFEEVFDVTSQEQYIASKIKTIIGETINTAKEILVDEKVSLEMIHYCLISQLSEPIINNHFLNGKVTFCSMTPMRNVPFKVVAMLGLNNGKFPRRDVSVSFDLMARLGRRAGDRTKRDDDRYLFLESILSARQNLYLSYIGRSIKTNKKQESSLILKELISYLDNNYCTKSLDDKPKITINEYPLHAFSKGCYTDNYRSYDDAWIKLIKQNPQNFYDQSGQDVASQLSENLTVSKLVKIFDNPLKAYANNGLGLYLEDNFDKLEGSEPFDFDNLVKHGLKEQLFDNISQGKDTKTVEKISKLSGKLPESVLTESELAEQVDNMQKLVESSQIQDQEKKIFKTTVNDIELEASCYVEDDNQIKLTTVSSFRIKHKLELYLTALIVACQTKKDVNATYFFLEKNSNKQFNEKTLELPIISYTQAKQELESYVNYAKNIITKPILSHLNLAEAIFEKPEKQKQKWDDAIKESKYSHYALEKDDYFNLFYNEPPEIEDFEGDSIYRGFFDVLSGG